MKTNGWTEEIKAIKATKLFSKRFVCIGKFVMKTSK